MNELEETEDVVNSFLNDLESSKLIKFPNSQLNDLFEQSASRAEIEHLAQSALFKIDEFYKKLPTHEKNHMIPEKEYQALQILTSVSQLQSGTEELKNFLKAILNPDIINPNITELGRYLSTIYDKLQYSKEKRQSMNEILLVDLRNTLNHNDYNVTLSGISYKKKTGQIEVVPIQKLLVTMIKYSIIMDAINKYIIKLRQDRNA